MVRTLGTVLGERKSLIYAAVCWSLSALAFAQLHIAAMVVFLVYPVLALYIMIGDIDFERAYWWFPTITAVIGVLLILLGLWPLWG